MGQNLTVGTGLIIINESNQVLLVKEQDAKRGGERDRWGIVGGVLEPNLNFIDNAIKEAVEETGYLVKIIGLVSIYQHIDIQYNRISIIFKAMPVKKKGDAMEKEIADISWFDYDSIPWDNLRFPHNKEMIQDAYRLDRSYSMDVLVMNYLGDSTAPRMFDA